MLQKLLIAFLAIAKGHAQYQLILKKLLQFCDISLEELEIWLGGGRRPRGLKFIKLREAFVGSGFVIEEYQQLAQSLQDACLLLAYDVIKSQEVCVQLGYKHHDEFLRPLTTGDRMPGQARLDAMNKLFSPYFSESLFKLNRFNDLYSLREMVTDLALNGEVKKSFDSGNFQHLIKALSELIIMGIPAAEILVDANVEARNKFRDEINSSDGNMLFDFSNRLHNFSVLIESLCSETAHKNFKGRDK